MGGLWWTMTTIHCQQLRNSQSSGLFTHSIGILLQQLKFDVLQLSVPIIYSTDKGVKQNKSLITPMAWMAQSCVKNSPTMVDCRIIWWQSAWKFFANVGIPNMRTALLDKYVSGIRRTKTSGKTSLLHLIHVLFRILWCLWCINVLVVEERASDFDKLMIKLSVSFFWDTGVLLNVVKSPTTSEVLQTAKN